MAEYAKVDPEDIVIRVSVHNRGPDAAPIQVLPHLWFRNTWSWGERARPEPMIEAAPAGPGPLSLVADDTPAEPLRNLPFAYRLGPRRLYVEGDAELLFTDNETNAPRVYGPWARSRKPYVKDAFHRFVVDGDSGAVSPDPRGTKACARLRAVVPAGGTAQFRFRLAPQALADPLASVDAVLAERRAEADAFYDAIHPPGANDDERLIQRQAFAGMLWSKQIYLFDVAQWLDGDNPNHPPPPRQEIRNKHWRSLNSSRPRAAVRAFV